MVPAGRYFQENLRVLGINGLEGNLFTVALYGTWVVWLLFFTGSSEWLNERLLLSSLSQIWAFPMLVALVYLPEDRDHRDTYALTMLLSAQPFVHAILAGLASRNSGSVRSRTISAALYNMCFQVSSIIGHNVRLSSPNTLPNNSTNASPHRSTAHQRRPSTIAAITY